MALICAILKIIFICNFIFPALWNLKLAEIYFILLFYILNSDCAEKMKLQTLLIAVQILLILTLVNSYSRKFLQIENCTTSGKTSVIEECQFKDSRFNFSIRIFNGSEQSIVRMKFKFL